MADEEKDADLDEPRADPKKPFYITAWLNLDGNLDISSEGKDPLSFETAFESAREQIDDHGDDAIYIIECRAIRRLTRGKIRIETVKTKSTR